MSTSKKSEVSAVAAAIAKAEAKAKREALEAHMALDIRAVKLDAGSVTQHRFHPTRQWRFDFAWPQRKVALEVDGGVHTGGRHTTGAGFTEDCEKVNAAVILGWRVLRVTGAHVKSGKAVGWLEELLRPRAVVLADIDDVAAGELAHDKERVVRSPKYLREVASLPCCNCGREGASQAAHTNRGKGMGIKAGDNFTFPLCTFTLDHAVTTANPSCHYRFDNYQLGDKHWAAEQGLKWAKQTYSVLKRAGKVPMNVPAPK